LRHQEKEEIVGKNKIKKMREMGEVHAFERMEAPVRKMKVEVSGLLETLQCCFFTHFGYGGAQMSDLLETV
jgi:hypothetical protein